MDKLLPCPWCNKQPELWEHRGRWWVDCQENDCEVNPGTCNDRTKQQAIDAWNTRVNPTVAKEKYENPN